MMRFEHDKHYSHTISLGEVEINTSHWFSTKGYFTGLSSILCITTGAARVQVNMDSTQCRNLAGMLLAHADDVDLHSAELSMKEAA